MYEQIKLLRGGIHLPEKGYVHIKREAVPSTELILVTAGVLHIYVGSIMYSLVPGTVLKIDPNTPHGGYKESDSAEFMWLHLIAQAGEAVCDAVFSPARFDRAILLGREALHYLESPEYPPECADRLLRVMLAELNQRIEDSDGLLWSVKRLVDKRNGAIGIVECAETLGYNEDYLSRRFKSGTGIGLKSYIDGVRLDRAKRMLLTESLSLAQISESLGFSDCKSFLKFFKYHSSLTPSEYLRSIYKH